MSGILSHYPMKSPKFSLKNLLKSSKYPTKKFFKKSGNPEFWYSFFSVFFLCFIFVFFFVLVFLSYMYSTKMFDWFLDTTVLTLLLRLLAKHYTLHLPFYLFPFLVETLPKYQGIRSKKYFSQHPTANTIQLFVAIKRDFSGFFFFRKSRSEGEFSVTS